MAEVRCPKCGNDERIAETGSSTTLMGFTPFWSGGVRHSHNPNKISTSFECPCGERWKTTYCSPCFAKGCGYGWPVCRRCDDTGQYRHLDKLVDCDQCSASEVRQQADRHA